MERIRSLHERLCEAAITGDIRSLEEIIGEDPLILHKFADGCSIGTSPLHVAASNNHLQFTEELLRRKTELTELLDSQQRSALHLASAKGHYEIVQVLVKANADMCLVRDRDGQNPLHVAAVKGKINVLKALVGACPEAARDRVDRDETILHLCVKHNHLESLEVLLEITEALDLVNARDSDGNTILHLSVLYKRFKIASHILAKSIIDVNATNASGQTALDLLFLKSSTKVEEHFEDILLQANAKQAKDLVIGDWLTKKKDSLMVVASLIATMAFQAAVNPPGSVWQDNSDGHNNNNSEGHRAGEAVMAYNYQDSYPYFLRFNTIGFVASLSTILLLISGINFKTKAAMWILMMTMWLAITSTAITFAFANVVVTPIKDRRPLSHTIKIGVIVWTGVMSLLLLKHTINLVTIFAKEKRAIKRNMRLKPESLILIRSLVRRRDGGAVPPRSLSGTMRLGA